MKNIRFKSLCNVVMLTVILALMPLLVSAEEMRLQNRKEAANNEQLRRAVKQDRAAAKLAHEKEMVKQREADTRRLATMESSKKHYQKVLAERHAAKTHGPDVRRTAAKRESGKLENREKQKTR